MNRSLLIPMGVVVLLAGSGVVPVKAQPMSRPYGGASGSTDGISSLPPGNPQQGQQLARGKCAACHGPEGNGVSALPQYPKLAGQNPTYLYRQILAFKSGARKSDVMAPLVVGLSDAEAADVARFYSDQPIKPDSITDHALSKQGERVFTARTGGPRAPTCAMCHAPNQRMPMMGTMMGVNPAEIPLLYGQHADYIFDQLNRYASGARPDGVMNGYAAALNESNRKAVAVYLSGLR